MCRLAEQLNHFILCSAHDYTGRGRGRWGEAIRETKICLLTAPYTCYICTCIQYTLFCLYHQQQGTASATGAQRSSSQSSVARAITLLFIFVIIQSYQTESWLDKLANYTYRYRYFYIYTSAVYENRAQYWKNYNIFLCLSFSSKLSIKYGGAATAATVRRSRLHSVRAPARARHHKQIDFRIYISNYFAQTADWLTN